MQYSEQVREAMMIAETLADGDTVRTDCPACEHKTYTVTRLPGTVFWNCFRNSCSIAGVAHAHALPRTEHVRAKTKVRHFQGELRNLTEFEVQYFEDRFFLPASLTRANIRATVHMPDRWAIRINSPDRKQRGLLLRGEFGGNGKKADVYMEKDEPVMSWYGYSAADLPLVVVEDQISALRVSAEGGTAAALIGTSLSLEKVAEIQRENPSEVIFALDRDATSKSFEHARKWGQAFRKSRVVILDRDIKDESGDWTLRDLGIVL